MRYLHLFGLLDIEWLTVPSLHKTTRENMAGNNQELVTSPRDYKSVDRSVEAVHQFVDHIVIFFPLPVQDL